MCFKDTISCLFLWYFSNRQCLHHSKRKKESMRSFRSTQGQMTNPKLLITLEWSMKLSVTNMSQFCPMARLTLQNDIVSWKPDEGHYHKSTMFCWEPEGRYHCTEFMAIAPFWFSTEHRWTALKPFWLSANDIGLTSWQPFRTEQWWILIRWPVRKDDSKSITNLGIENPLDLSWNLYQISLE